jgi:two-component system response regulator FixJ
MIHALHIGAESLPRDNPADAQPVVAIVDDDDAVRHSTARFLEGAGYRVREFESGDAFLASQYPGDSDCILLDLRMPGTDGLGVLKSLGGWEAMPRVLVLTGHGAVKEAVEAIKLGAADFLEKPYPADALLSVIAKALLSRPAGKAVAIDAGAAARMSLLSARQMQVLRGVIKGQPNKVIAWELRLSIRTIEAYRAQVLERLGVRGTAEAVRLAAAAGMLEN